LPNDIIEQANLSSSWTAELVAKLHEAMPATNDTDRREQVRAALAEQIGIETCLQHPDTLEAPAASYGRRLLYRDPGGAFTVVLMIWGGGQGTPLHDHAGLWVVEAVCLGTITVESYKRKPARADGSGLHDFDKVLTVEAGIGETEALIPPFDYHTIHNHHDKTAATIHVYGGDLTECNIFLPEGSGYRQEVMPLAYSD
jgi:predicted metal-dependent enzyme (double-stranded beta helix superfamily)